MITVGPFHICGVHEEPVELAIILTPEPHLSVYGWGDQPATREHLLAIAERVQPGMRVVDIGTGTGILAIAAARLGAEVTAYESVAQFREVARRNFEANGLDIALFGAWPDDWDGVPFGLVLANTGDDPIDVVQAGEVIGRG